MQRPNDKCDAFTQILWYYNSIQTTTSPYRHLKASKRMHFLEHLTHCRYEEIFLLWITWNLAFALLYFTLAQVAPEHALIGSVGTDLLHHLGNSVYFAVITGTSTGYGDITPIGLSKLLAVFQCTGALVIFAVFLSKLTMNQCETTVSHRHGIRPPDARRNLDEAEGPPILPEERSSA